MKETTVLPALVDFFGENFFQQEQDGWHGKLTNANRREDEAFRFLQESCAPFMLMDIIALHQQTEEKIELIYSFFHLPTRQRFFFHLVKDEKESFVSIASFFKSAEWLENEVFDLMGVRFNREEMFRLFTQDRIQGYPLRKDFKFVQPSVDLVARPLISPRELSAWQAEKTVNLIEYGPASYLARQSLRLQAILLDDKIMKAEIEVGYRHRGLEKALESLPYSELLPLMSKLNPVVPWATPLLYLQLMEEALAIRIPERAMAIRMMLLEWARIYNHLHFLTHFLYEIGGEAHLSFVQQAQARVGDWFEFCMGTRFHPVHLTLGGQKVDFSGHHLTVTLDLLQQMRQDLAVMEQKFTGNRGWMDRLAEGALSTDLCFAAGITGPALRANGINHDLRKISPFYFYHEMDFNVPLGHCGTAYDRYLVMMEEMKESLRIIAQLLDHFPAGPVLAGELATEISNHGKSFSQVVHDIDRKTKSSFQLPKGHYSATLESPLGELGLYAVSDGGNTPIRMKIRSPSFPLLMLYPRLLRGRPLEQSSLILTTLNASFEEMDR